MTTMERLQKILAAHYPMHADGITRDASLEQLDIDSLGIMELFFAIEDEFGISVPNDKRALRTVGDLADYIDELSARQDASTGSSQDTVGIGVHRAAP